MVLLQIVEINKYKPGLDIFQSYTCTPNTVDALLMNDKEISKATLNTKRPGYDREALSISKNHAFSEI